MSIGSWGGIGENEVTSASVDSTAQSMTEILRRTRRSSEAKRLTEIQGFREGEGAPKLSLSIFFRIERWSIQSLCRVLRGQSSGGVCEV